MKKNKDKPKLLSINNYHYKRGGSDAVFLDHDAMFKKRNWDTAVFAMQHPKNDISQWSEYFIEELEFGNSYGLFAKIPKALKVIYSFEARKNLAQLLDNFHPNIAHLHCIYHHISPSILSLLHDRGIPCVLTAHDLKLACPAYKMLNLNGICEKCKDGNFIHLIKNRCIHNSLSVSALVAVESSVHKLFGMYKNNLDKIISPSRFFKEKLSEWGWDPENIVYIPNFINCESIIPQYDPGKYFLYVGRLAPEKGLVTLIRAAILSNVNLIIAGTGPSEKELKAEAIEAKNIHFVGYKSGDDLWKLISNSRAIVLPSEWYENAPISVLEAYACGKPVIGANIGGIPEMLKDGDTGLIFESGSIHDLAEKLIKYNSYPNNEIRRIGKNARNYVAATYNPDIYYETMANLYSTLGVNFGTK